MPSKNNNEISTYYNTINIDYTGERTLDGDEEKVEFHLNTSSRIWLNDLSVDFPAHWHQALEIIMPVESTYGVECSGELYQVETGNIILIPPGEIHTLTAPPEGKRFIFIMDISLISKLQGFVGIKALLTKPLIINKETFPLIYDDIYQILLQMRNEYFRNGEYTELAIQALLLNLFIKLGENHNNADALFPNVRVNKQKEYVQRFNQILEYIDEHYMEDITLEDTAKTAGFSKYHFSRLFKQYTEFTFCDYLCFRRVKAAAEQLAEPDYSITDIAMNSGFPSISTFNRLFKQQMGCTPREYRSKNTGKPRM